MWSSFDYNTLFYVLCFIYFVVYTVSSLSRLNKTILAHYSRFNKIATLGYIMAHEGMGTDHYSMSRLTMRRSHSSTGYCYILPVDEL